MCNILAFTLIEILNKMHYFWICIHIEKKTKNFDGTDIIVTSMIIFPGKRKW
jgi:hypothetical protein